MLHKLFSCGNSKKRSGVVREVPLIAPSLWLRCPFKLGYLPFALLRQPFQTDWTIADFNMWLVDGYIQGDYVNAA